MTSTNKPGPRATNRWRAAGQPEANRDGQWPHRDGSQASEPPTRTGRVRRSAGAPEETPARARPAQAKSGARRTAIKCQRVAAARRMAKPILISLIQCATLIACSAQLLAANNSSAQQRQQRSTDEARAPSEASQPHQLAEQTIVTHLSLADPLDKSSSESRLAQVAAIRAPFADLQRHEDRFNNGRLVDSIAEPLQQQASLDSPLQQQQQQQQQDKLNYIIDFLRQNRLTTFCDLLQSGDVRVRDLIDELNSMRQFTLFVPTNEALLLMSSAQLEAIESSPEETRQFLMAHATGELVVPRLNDFGGQSLALLASKYSPAGAQNRWSSGRPMERIVQPAGGSNGQTLLYSLSGSPLRVVTTPVLVATSSPTNPVPSTRLELIVNGANVLSGHSHALQEPNNTSITYAIVHLIDRPLYPTPRSSLFDQIQQVAPRFARLIQASQDQPLIDQLRSGSRGQQLTTGFVPNDDAFRSIPTKLLEQLETNRTFLRHFLRTHLVEGLFFSGQLATPLAERPNGNASALAANSVPRLLSSMAGVELEFETKVIQSRQLILVNSIPILDQDQTVLNGVLHVIVRPIFERHLLDVACNCESSKLNTDNQMTDLLRQLASESQERYANHRLEPARSSWHRAAARYSDTRNELDNGPNPSPSSELEREESQPLNRVFRSQRSEDLVARNNRDFYRPSTAPANLVLQPYIRNDLLALEEQRRRLEILNANTNSGRGFLGVGESQLDPRLSNLTRQDEQLIRPGQNWADAARQANSGPPFAGQPPETASSFEVERYKIIMDANMRQKLREQQQQQQQQAQSSGIILSSSLKSPAQADIFAYDQPLAGAASGVAPDSNSLSRSESSRLSYSAQVQPAFNSNVASEQANLSASSLRNQRLLKFQAEDARDTLVGDQSTKVAGNFSGLQRQGGKTGAPPAGANFNGCAFYDTECKRLQMAGKFVRLPARPGGKSSSQVKSANQTGPVQSNVAYQPTTPASAFDSSFGETTLSPYANTVGGRLSKVNPQTLVTPPQHSPKNYMSFNPPGVKGPPRVSPLNQPLPPWGADESKLLGSATQLQPAPAYAPGKQGLNVNWRAQDVGDLARLNSTKQANRTSQLQSIIASGQPSQILLIPLEMFQNSNVSFPHGRGRLLNSTQTGPTRPIYYAPPAGQTSDRDQQRASPVLFGPDSQYFAPTVRPLFDSSDRLPNRPTNFSTFDNGPADSFDASSTALSGASKQSPRQRAPLPVYSTQVGGEEQRPLNDSLQSAIQQARKVVRLQTSPYQQAELASGQTKSDISITSARLTRPSANYSSGGLAVLASNALDVNLARPPPLIASAPEASAMSQDFFQNRTIAEIMDDSGLRIDGQQVTFGRLRDCLDRADLSNLIMQQGSGLTIFMPTDLAFQRLVQQQALLQQRTSRSSGSAGASSRLQDRRHLIPLVARAGSSRLDANSELARLQADSSADSSLALAQRLTLDCSTQQVRQLLLDHLSAQLITPKQLQNDLILASLSGRRLLLSSVPSKKIVVVDGQPVIAATRAKNGMVYVVNKFLNITQQVPNVIDLLDSQPNLKTFQSYLAFASLTDRLKRETEPITILAPTNEAFDQLSVAARHLLNSDPAAMMDILRGHIVEGAQFGKLISMRNRLKTMNSDHFIEAKVIKPNVYQLDDQMTSMRLVGTSGNGVVNAIDRLIVPPWLKVSSGASTSGAGRPSPERGSNELDVDARNALASGTSNLASFEGASRQSANLNLPQLNNRPLRFEQPAAARLAPANSFGLAGSTTIGPNSIDVFDPTPRAPILFGSELAAGRLNSTSGGDSPFLRIANNSIAAESGPAGSRLSGGRLGSPADDDQPGGLTANSTKNMRLIEKLASLMKARKFIKYLVRSRLSDLLKPDMNYVILVPTDQAVERLPRQIIDVLERDPDRLGDLVNFHVLDTTFEYINTIPDGQTLNTLNEKDILFNWHRNNTILTASGAVVLGGIQEENIALLIVDRVLYPTPGDLLSIVTKSPILSNFTSLIRNAGLERQLSNAGPFTLFAPSDFAFNQLEKRDLEFLQNNRESARRFLLRHLSQPAIFTSSIALSNSTDKLTSATVPLISVTNSLGEDLTLRQKNDYFSVNDVNFSYADVAATNGVVHVIDGLL